ncbi:LOB domain-containing protein 18-like [Ananas comosus]|uniref:LOB domain-containing protein 18-like n=1 Tax=Ananas comosus TaxID=4615 RepID=A0A6P5FEH9_ANACO|nr:LOB domain-containing protein 18-like [Ananas comosus]
MSGSSTCSIGGGSGGGGGGSGGGSGPCGACKFLRRKCVTGCIFAPYFDSEQGAAHFAAVHKVFGASNVSKLLLHIPAHKRLDAVVTICYEAHARLRDPVYGCVSHIFALQQQVVSLQAELSYLQAHLATLELPSPPPLPPPLPQFSVPLPPFSISDLPSSSSNLPTSVDLSALFDPLMTPSQQQPLGGGPWAALQPQPQQRPVGPGGSGGGGGDLQALARELLNRQRSAAAAATAAEPPPPLSKCK